MDLKVYMYMEDMMFKIKMKMKLSWIVIVMEKRLKL